MSTSILSHLMNNLLAGHAWNPALFAIVMACLLLFSSAVSVAIRQTTKARLCGAIGGVLLIVVSFMTLSVHNTYTADTLGISFQKPDTGKVFILFASLAMLLMAGITVVMVQSNEGKLKGRMQVTAGLPLFSLFLAGTVSSLLCLLNVVPVTISVHDRNFLNFALELLALAMVLAVFFAFFGQRAKARMKRQARGSRSKMEPRPA